MRSHAPSLSAFPHLTLALLALLACGSGKVNAQTETEAPAAQQVQLAPLPETEQFSQLVDFRVRPSGESLDTMIQALARSVGLSAVTQGIPADTVVSYDFAEPKPFREIWDIVLTLNGLEYVLRGDNIVVVGPPSVLESLQPQEQTEEPRVAVTYPVNSPPSQLQALLESQFPAGSGVTVTAFDDLGLMSVRGTAVQQTRVKDLLDRFDRSEAVQVRRIYPLSYAKASNLAGVLLGTLSATNTLGSAEQRTVSDLCSSDSAADSSLSSEASTNTAATADSGTEDTPNPLSISADSRTNRLIVTAPVRVQEEIETLIEALDRPERQVNIQVRIQEVSGEVNDRLGINLTTAIGNFTTTLFSGDDTSGLNFIFDAQKAITGFNLGAVLDAFERQGLSRKVDDSNLTVLNNGVATLQAGGNRYISIASAGGESNIERTIPYGVIVGLTPQITNNNNVVLDVCARVDVPLTEADDPGFQDISTRRLNSRITLQPGQTIALGGLLQNQDTETTRSVPILGDVPIVGNLFKSETSTKRDSELLLIVTANVLE